MALGEYGLAEAFFRDAAQRLPGYIAAEEHLAEVLLLAGKTSESIHLYESIVERADNPEFVGALASAYAGVGRNQEAEALLARARARYESLIREHPAATYEHAAGFFAQVSREPERALQLLAANVELRSNSTSWLALAKVQLQLGRLPDAKQSIDGALSMPLVSADLYETAAAIEEALGNHEAHDRYRARERTFRPRYVCRAPNLDAAVGH